MNRLALLAITAVLVVVAAGSMVSRAGNQNDLAPPFAVTAGDIPIDISFDGKGRLAHNNAFPWFGDFDGDGRPDLLVGQHTHAREPGMERGGRLRIYKNVGEKGKPRFGDPSWFDSTVPTGRIPDG